MNSSPTTNVEEVKIKLAGADMTVTPGKIKGALHAIPIPLWQAIVGFHRQISIKYKAESMSYHRWYEKDKCYHSLIPYQETSYGSLAVKTDWTDERNITLLNEYAKEYKEEFFPACTIHTHVDIGAFESGTDAADEEFQPGWHITLGELLSHQMIDVSLRIRLPKLKKISSLVNVNNAYEIEINNLFDPSVNKDELFALSGTTDWHDKLDRVEITKKLWASK